MEDADILLRSGAQHVCPSSSRRFCCARLMILFDVSSLAGSVLNAFPPRISREVSVHQLKYFFSFTHSSSSSSPNDARSVGSELLDVSHIRLARKHSVTSWEGRSQVIDLPDCRSDGRCGPNSSSSCLHVSNPKPPDLVGPPAAPCPCKSEQAHSTPVPRTVSPLSSSLCCQW